MGDMSATTSPKTLSKLTRLALTNLEFQTNLLPFIRHQASMMLPPRAKLRVDLRRAAATTTDPILGLRIAQALDDRAARFEEGTKVDVAQWLEDQDLPEAAKKWRENTEKYKDKFTS